MTDDFKCSYCKNPIKESDEFCPSCKFPLKGTEKEKSIFIGQQILKKDTIKKAIGARKFAKYIMIFIGLWYVLYPMINLFSNNYTIGDLIQLFIGLIFIVLGLISNKTPQFSLLIAIGLLLLNVIFITIVVYKIKSPIFSEATDFIRYIFKEIIKIGLLIYALYKTRQEIQIKKEHQNLNSIN